MTAKTESEQHRRYRLSERCLAKHRDYARKQLYGLEYGQYDAMLAAQGGVCAICSRPPKTRALHVDHDHATGRVRGLLCNRCNGLLAALDDREWNATAQAYLDKAIATLASKSELRA